MLNSNNLKFIAIICMIIDHIGYFFQSNMDYSLYIICRSIGRIAMPLFVFMIVEGFFNTKNLKKYIFRLSVVAFITQVIIITFNYIDINFFNNKVPNLNSLNIIFSFVLILILLRTIDNKFVQNRGLDIFLRILSLVGIVFIYLNIDIDYGIYGVLIAIVFYTLKKLDKKMIPFIKYLIQITLVSILSILSINNLIGIFVIFSSICMILYNNKKGKKSKITTIIFYSVFPMQYLLMYVIKLFI